MRRERGSMTMSANSPNGASAQVTGQPNSSFIAPLKPPAPSRASSEADDWKSSVPRRRRVVERVAEGKENALGSDPGAFGSRQDGGEVAIGRRRGFRERRDRCQIVVHRVN